MVVKVNETLDKTQSGWGNFQSKWNILRSCVQIYIIINTNQRFYSIYYLILPSLLGIDPWVVDFGNILKRSFRQSNTVVRRMRKSESE